MPHQILSLKTYLEKTRPQLKRKNGWQSFCLFPVKKTGDMLARILSLVKKLHPDITSSRQLRASVIMGWLKTNNIRQTQFMAGHKNIQSTEKYRRQDTTGLARQLELFHPLE
jgi:site-specific recombinase XerD